MSRNVNEVIKYFEDLYKLGSIYVWGMNGQIITPQIIVDTYHAYRSATYDSKYYENKLKEGEGRIGCDCSGCMFPVSGADNTAQGYYDACITKGAISGIDKNKACLVFKHNGSRINHIGFYCGNGYTIEMESSKTNCVKRELAKGTWTHYGVPKWIDYSSVVTVPLPANTLEVQGIDVSSYQGTIDWSKVKASGIKFAILRGVLKNGTMDTTFEANYNSASAQGLDVAIYQYSYDLSEADATKSANNLIAKLNGKKLAIWLDLEWATQGALGKAKVTSIAKAYVKACQSKGYDCHIYSNFDWYKNKYDFSQLSVLGCKLWIARYSKSGAYTASLKPNVGEMIWQHSKGQVPGISGEVDMDTMYVTTTTTTKPTTKPTTESINAIDKMVIITGNVFKRTSPFSDSDGNKCGVYQAGTQVHVKALTMNKSWYQDDDGHFFSANAKYVKDMIGVVYNCTQLNVREEPNGDKGTMVITKLNSGAQAAIINVSNGWYYIRLSDGTKGWVNGNFITIN